MAARQEWHGSGDRSPCQYPLLTCKQVHDGLNQGVEPMHTERHAAMLGEIEACVAEHSQVQQAIVADLGNRLVAYVVATAGEALEEEQLRTHLRGRLPAYKMPRYFVMLEAMPLTAEGQVDRNALPDPQAAQAGIGVLEPGPMPGQPGGRAQYLIDLWAGLLHCDVSPDDNFFDLGGHSMLAVQMANRVHRDTGVRIQLMTLATQSLAQIAATLPNATDAPPARFSSRLLGKFKGLLQA